MMNAHCASYSPGQIAMFGATHTMPFKLLKGAPKLKPLVGQEYEIVLKFSESLISHVEIAGLQAAYVDVFIKLQSHAAEEKVVFSNAELYQYFKTPSKKYQHVLEDYKPPVSVQTAGKPSVLRLGSLPATHIKIKLYGGKGKAAN